MAPVPGLLSVVLWAGDSRARPLLDEALFSLACQEYQPLELLLVTALGGRGRARAAGALPDHRRLLRSSSSRRRPRRRSAEGIRRARGQYVSFLDAACIVYPDHYVKLVQDAAGGPGRVGGVPCAPDAPPGRGAVRAPQAAAAAGRAPGADAPVPRAVAAVRPGVDRSRLGPFPLEQAAERASELPLRLAALFEPAFLGGIASCEQRFTGLEQQGPGRCRCRSCGCSRRWAPWRSG